LAAILGITFPIFAVIALGYFAVWNRAFSAEDTQALGRFAMNVALPALMFSAATGGGQGGVFHLPYVIAYAAAGLGTVVLSLGWFRLNLVGSDTGPARRAIAVMGSACPNSAYVGFPVLMLAVPQVAAPAFAMNVLVESFLIVPLCFMLLSASRPKPGSTLWQRGLSAATEVIRKPMVLGFLAGISVSALGIPLPEPFSRFVAMLATATAGLALFFIGGSLVNLPMKGNVAMAVQIAGSKLMLHPALATGAAAALVWVGLPGLSADWRTALILSAAMPMFGVYALIAQEAGHQGLAAIALLAATVGAFFTVSGLLVMLL
jgi:predicted permease